MLDVDLLKTPEGVKKIKDSLEKRFQDTAIVDECVEMQKKLRATKYEFDCSRAESKENSKNIYKKKKAGEPSDDLIEKQKKLGARIEELKEGQRVQEAALQKRFAEIGNIVLDKVPISKEEDGNKEFRVWGEELKKERSMEKPLHHDEIMYKLDALETIKGAKVAGHRAYFLKGVGVLLNQALISFGLEFLTNNGYVALQPPYFMNASVMSKTAQLSQFDEELYKVVEGKGEEAEKYLIATSEQPISAFHMEEWLPREELPKKYAGLSTNFRKEAGSHGKDTWGIFRVHQFEKVEQFCITAPERSQEMFDAMIEIAEEFYKQLGLPYHLIYIASGALNNAAAIKCDLEAWFPTLEIYRELVSVSNCTDYQAISLNTRYDPQKGDTKERKKEYVHMLNGTLCATERTLCCILENYQAPDGLHVPEPLQKYLGGKQFLPYVKKLKKLRGKVKV